MLVTERFGFTLKQFSVLFKVDSLKKAYVTLLLKQFVVTVRTEMCLVKKTSYRPSIPQDRREIFLLQS